MHPQSKAAEILKKAILHQNIFSGIIAELIQKLFTAKQGFYIRFE